MPVLVFASPKGGCGKSTAAVIAGTEAARLGISVTMLDCDPNRSLTKWSERGEIPPNITVKSGITQSTIIPAIRDADGDGRLVVVDLEGVASQTVSRAVSKADLVIVPMRPTALDSQIGSQAIELIREEEDALERTVPFAVLFSSTKAVRSNESKDIEKSLRANGIDLIEPSLMERGAYSAIFAYGGDLSTMPPRGNMENAKRNATEYAQAILTRLTGSAS